MSENAWNRGSVAPSKRTIHRWAELHGRQQSRRLSRFLGGVCDVFGLFHRRWLQGRPLTEVPCLLLRVSGRIKNDK
jgi:hypothetical protein